MPKRATAAKKQIAHPYPSDALLLLKQDHQRVSRLLEECIAAVPGSREQLARHIFQELNIHAALEEELFYPALVQELGESTSDETGHQELNGTAVLLDDDESDGEEALEEEDSSDEEQQDAIVTALEDHHAVKQMIEQLRTMDARGEEFQRMMAELQSMVLYHIDEEEEVIFPEARLVLDIELLGKRMHERKQELLAS